MRPIKYRCLYRHEWYDVEEAGFENGIIYPTKFKGEIFSPDSDHIKCVVQFTGLLDKKGVEIYEGDFIRQWTDQNSGFGPENIYYEIRYHGDGFYLYNIFLKSVISNWELRKLAEHYEIIGNIYSNPELLSNSK